MIMIVFMVSYVLRIGSRQEVLVNNMELGKYGGIIFYKLFNDFSIICLPSDRQQLKV